MQIFMDMAVLVDAQGEMLDNIETQVIKLFDLLWSNPWLLTRNRINNACDRCQVQ